MNSIPTSVDGCLSQLWAACQPVKPSDAFTPLSVYEQARDFEGRYLVCFGGSGSGKSHFAAQKISDRARREPGHRLLTIRKVGTTIRRSTYLRYQKVLDAAGESYTPRATLDIEMPGSVIWNLGLDDPNKLKSIEDPTSIWIEEAAELYLTGHPETDDLMHLDLRMRGPSPSYKQIIFTLNPTPAAQPLFERLGVTPSDVPLHGTWESEDGQVLAVHSTYLDNPHVGEEYVVPFRRLSQAQRDVYEHGLFALIDEPDQLISHELVKRAFEIDPASVKREMPRLGADVAWTGNDMSSIGYADDFYVTHIDAFRGVDPTRVGDLVALAIEEKGYPAYRCVIDGIGMGATVWSNLLSDGYDVRGFLAGNRNPRWKKGMPDEMRKMRFGTLRDQAWWYLRYLLENRMIAFADFDEDIKRMLRVDLTAPRYRYRSGRVEVEPKQGTRSWGIRQRIGRSTDLADTLIHMFFAEFLPQRKVPKVRSLV